MFDSSIIEDRVQVDGRRHVLERHVDRHGKQYDFGYMAESDTNVQAVLAARAVALQDQLTRQSEAEESENGLWPD